VASFLHTLCDHGLSVPGGTTVIVRDHYHNPAGQGEGVSPGEISRGRIKESVAGSPLREADRAAGHEAVAGVSPPSPSVAIVHDHLAQFGGAERVVLEMVQHVWPNAPLYTALYRPELTYPALKHHDIRTSFLDRLGVDEGFRALLPLFPAAFRLFGTLRHDIVVSSSSGWAHAVRTGSATTHVVYCYAPARWLYSGHRYTPSAVERRLLSPLMAALRRWDRRAAQRPDAYIAISNHVRERVKDAYGIDATVVYPPVDTERFSPQPRGRRLLVLSRLLSYKRIDLVVTAAKRMGIGLDIVGAGPELERLMRIAGPTVEFHGALPDPAVSELLENCWALCLPGAEDFALTPLEANAAGKPVVAFAGGGALETQVDGRTAVFFNEGTVESLIDALRAVDRIETAPEDIAREARRFGRDAFRANLRRAVDLVAERSERARAA
jgi:glycosyltransferase involved in cell wall biosynthesis